VKWETATGQSLALGYGLHSQVHPLALYFYSLNTGEGSNKYPNQSLDFTKAHHFIISYDRLLNEHTRLKAEAYYQSLYGVPVSADKRDAFSLLNVTEGFISKRLSNNGQGENYGLELTWERFLHNSFYYLVSGSVFKSRYQGADQIWRSTRFDAGSALNVLTGKEWRVGQGKNNVLGINLKMTYIGGFRTTPIDLIASRKQGQTV
jgi:hypothetical protein